MLKNSLEAMVGSVEAVMSGVSDQLAVERKKRKVRKALGKKESEG